MTSFQEPTTTNEETSAPPITEDQQQESPASDSGETCTAFEPDAATTLIVDRLRCCATEDEARAMTDDLLRRAGFEAPAPLPSVGMATKPAIADKQDAPHLPALAIRELAAIAYEQSNRLGETCDALARRSHERVQASIGMVQSALGQARTAIANMMDIDAPRPTPPDSVRRPNRR